MDDSRQLYQIAKQFDQLKNVRILSEKQLLSAQPDIESPAVLRVAMRVRDEKRSVSSN
ncbi:hypothetical protein [Algicola sagamiensis]|uniref:hypothetical protein n=1 Tax=Algicola sagamiensis TaxID=163869 RepID=UPI00037E2C95|nr:hypothetical protein [Algicola sagamiensis]